MWDSVAQATAHKYAGMRLSLHSGRIAKLLIREEEMISLGEEDGMAIVFKHRPYIEKSDPEPFIE